MTPPPLPSLGEIVRTFARIGLLGFGGPAAQIALMHRMLVEEKRWIGETRFLHALNYCMLLPGPEAQQLATYVGWLLRGWRGGLIAGLLFVLPGAAIMLVLSALYALWADIPLVQGLFYGVKCAVLAIVVQALARLAARALKSAAMVWIAACAFLALFLFALPFPLVVAAAALAGFALSRALPGSMSAPAAHAAGAGPASGLVDRLIEAGGLAHTRPDARRFRATLALWLGLWLTPVALIVLLAPGTVWAGLATFFSKMAVVTFGGAYAVLSYVAQQAVEVHGWLTGPQMIDGLGLAETTPGPLILVLQFVGFLAAWGAAGPLDPLLAGALGALLTLWVVFAPSFLFIFAGAPYAEALRRRPGIAAALSGVTAAVVGVILNLALWFAMHVLVRGTQSVAILGLPLEVPDLATIDPLACALAGLAAILVFRLRLGVAALVALFAAAGAALSAAGLVP